MYNFNLTKEQKDYLDNFCFIIAGKSGSGKTTISDKIEEMTKGQLKVLRSYTTRPPRFKDDKDHTYITEKEYNKLTNKIATACINNYHYCATVDQYNESNIYVCDLEGIKSLGTLIQLVNCPMRKPIVIYLDVSKEERERRMRKQGRKEEEIQFRLKEDDNRFDEIEQYSDIIIKGDNTDWNEVIRNMADFIVNQICEIDNE